MSALTLFLSYISFLPSPFSSWHLVCHHLGEECSNSSMWQVQSCALLCKLRPVVISSCCHAGGGHCYVHVCHLFIARQIKPSKWSPKVSKSLSLLVLKCWLIFTQKEPPQCRLFWVTILFSWWSWLESWTLCETKIEQRLRKREGEEGKISRISTSLWKQNTRSEKLSTQIITVGMTTKQKRKESFKSEQHRNKRNWNKQLL